MLECPLKLIKAAMTVVSTIESLDAHRFLRWHIKRPERMNALGTTLATQLTDELRRLQSNTPQGIRALVLTAETVDKNGRSIWIAGGDLKELSTLESPEDALGYAKTMHRFCRDLELLPLPVVVYVDGEAIGGGAELALSADIRIGSLRAGFEWKQLRLGLTTGYGAAAKLCELVGKATAQRLLFLCETQTCDDAVATGVLHRKVTDWKEFTDVLRGLFELEPLALAGQKKLLHLATSTPSGDRTGVDRLFANLWRNPTHQIMLDEFAARKTGL